MFYGSIYGIIIVFQYIQYWKFLGYGYIERFVQCILVSGIIFEYGYIKVVGFLVFFCESDICIDWNLCINNIVIIKVVVFFVEEVY